MTGKENLLWLLADKMIAHYLMNGCYFEAIKQKVLQVLKLHL